MLWGRCYEERGMPPFWPWVQAIRSYVREKEPEELRSEMGSGAADIAEVISEVKERLPDLEPPPELESPEAARFRLFDSITSFLNSAGQRQPLVLVLDDLHWADGPSLLLLEFVAKELGAARILLLGTYRDMELSRQHPLAEALGELTRESLFQRILLRGLTLEDVGSFIELTSGMPPPSGLPEAVHTQTEGNPLFVTEVVRLLVQEGELSQERESWDVRIPEGVREVIGRRLNRLSSRCSEAMTVAAVLGREFDYSHLRPLLEETTEGQLLDVVEEALGGRVIEELPRTVGRYRFTHALVRHTLMDELTTTRRVRLHARIGEALEGLYGDEVESRAAQLAYHFGEAEAVLGSDKLVRYSMMAGERALDAYAWEEALAHFQRALAAREGQPLDAEIAALVYGLGRAQQGMTRPYEATHSLSRAFDYYADVGDVPNAVAIAGGFGTSGEREIERSSIWTRLITRALELVPPDSHEAGRLLVRYGVHLGGVTGDYEGAQEAFSRALGIAQREKDVALEMRTLASAAGAEIYRMRFQEALEKSLQAIELYRRAWEGQADEVSRLAYDAKRSAHLWATTSLLCMGDPQSARSHAEAMYPLAERLRNYHAVGAAYHWNALLALSQGDWQAARDLVDRNLPFGPDTLTRAVVLEYQVGNFNQGHAYLEQLLSALNVLEWAAARGTLSIAVAAHITGNDDGLDAAKSVAEVLLSSLLVPYDTVYARATLALIAVLRGDVQAAEELYAALVPHRGLYLVWVCICLDRVLSLFAHTMGKLDDSAAHFEDALAFCRKAGYRPELAWSLCDYADTLRDRSGPGDQEKAVKLLDGSLAISTELGMKPLMERVLSRREILGP